MRSTTHRRDYRLLLDSVREARKGARVTQVELAVRLEVTQSQISKIERRERRLDVIELLDICDAMGADPIKLLNDFLERRRVTRRLAVNSSRAPVRKRRTTVRSAGGAGPRR